VIERMPASEQNKPRRKWDCFHIATAQCLGCTTLYAWDEPLLGRERQLGIKDVQFLEPRPRNQELAFPDPPKPQKAQHEKAAEQPEARSDKNTPRLQADGAGSAGNAAGAKPEEEKE